MHEDMPETDEPLRLLILGAHPDDSEYHAGGLASIYRERGHAVRMVSLTDGQAGHFERPPHELTGMRRSEAAAAGAVIGAEYVTWDVPDGELMPDLPARRRVIREIRTFRPDLVLTHRPCDYHPDHRAAGQLVQDATYLVTVPNVLREVPPLTRDPVVAFLPDLFSKPCPLVPDILLDIGDRIDTVVAMLACQVSQVFEWLPYEEGILDQVPEGDAARREWLTQWYIDHIRPRIDRFRADLVAAYGPERGAAIKACEVYEISEYGATADLETRRRLFPTAVCREPGEGACATPSQG